MWIVLQNGSGTEMRIRTLSQHLQQLVYEYVCRSLFKADRLMFAMHLVHGIKAELFENNVRIYVEICFVLCENYLV